MLYAILCYNDEDVVCSWTKEEDDAVMARLDVVTDKRLAQEGKLGPAARLLPTTAATTVRQGQRSAAGDRRALRRDQGAAARLLRRRLSRRSMRRIEIARELGRGAIPGAPTRSGRSACSWPGSGAK